MGQELIVKKEIQLNADISKVWDVLTKPEWTKQYMFGCIAETDWLAGNSILWTAVTEGKKVVYVKGTIVSIEIGRLLQYTVFDPHATMEDKSENYTCVTYSLVPEHGKTVLTVSQGDFAKVAEGQKRFEETLQGWQSVLDSIKRLLEPKAKAI